MTHIYPKVLHTCVLDKWNTYSQGNNHKYRYFLFNDKMHFIFGRRNSKQTFVSRSAASLEWALKSFLNISLLNSFYPVLVGFVLSRKALFTTETSGVVLFPITSSRILLYLLMFAVRKAVTRSLDFFEPLISPSWS